MKKLFKLFGILIAVSTLMCLSSCKDIMGGSKDDKEEIINHEFYHSDKKGSYYYYTSTTSFTYTSPENGTVYDKTNPCIYQVCFTQGTNKGTWNMYTRPKSSQTPIDFVYKNGTYEGDVSKEGVIKLYIENELFQTITLETKTVQLENTTPTALVFTANITAAHKSIGAKDSK